MLEEKNILAVVPARGGSKGIHKKNLRLLRGLPLVAHVGIALQELQFIDKAVVSTDDLEICEAALSAGLEAPFLRPESLSGDKIGDAPVLEHALHECERLDKKKYDIIVMLQPTSPLRTPSDVKQVIERLILGNYDSVFTVSESDTKFHPYKQLVVGENGSVKFYDKRGESIVARQELSTLFHRNGAAYAITRRLLLQEKKVIGSNSAVVVSEGPRVNIDTEFDFKFAEFLLS